MTVRRVLIAGAGIGGLSLAAALRRHGIESVVFERAAELRPAGAGITVQINAMLALASLGMDAPVRKAGMPVVRAVIARESGRALQSVDVAAVERELGAPAVCLSRTRLQNALLGLLPEGVVCTGRSVRRYVEDEDGVTLHFDDGTSASGDLLVGADGLHSVVRRQLIGETPLRYAGYTSWRGICQDDAHIEPGVVSESWGRGLRFGIVPIGFGEVYWFAVANAPPGEKDAPGAVQAALLKRFGDWHAPIRRLVERTPEAAILRTDISDRAPISRWTGGRVALLGDAAHPMTPNLGQGGGQAIEDAVVLANALAAGADRASALGTYERRRMARANAVVARSRSFGRVAQLENPALRWLRDVALRAVPERLARRQMSAFMQFSG